MSEAHQEETPSDANVEDETIIVVTYATHSQGYFECLKESCEHYGYKLTVLGFGEKWRGYAMRLRAMRDFLATLPPRQLVLFVDAFDVIMCGPMREAVQTYKRIIGDRKMLAGASRCIGPPIFTKRLMDDEGCSDRCDDSSPYIYLCAGTYIVRASDGIELINRMAPFADAADDQKMLIQLRKKCGYATIGIDCRFDLFATLMPGGVSGVELRRDDQIEVFTDKRTGQRRIRSRITGTTPILIHGPANADLRPLLPMLGLTSVGEQPPPKYVAEKVMYHTRSVLKNSVDIFAIGALLLVALIAIVTLAVLYARERQKRQQLETRLSDNSQQSAAPTTTTMHPIETVAENNLFKSSQEQKGQVPDLALVSKPQSNVPASTD